MTKNWNDLPDDMKEMVVDNMDIFTRFRLKMCSKSDKRLVESVPLYCDEITATKISYGVNLHIEDVVVSYSDSYVWIYNGRTQKRRDIVVSGEKEGHEMVKKMFSVMMSHRDACIGCFNTNLKIDDLLPTPYFKIHVKHLKLGRNKRQDILKWLDAIVEQPDQLTIETLSPPVLKNVNRLKNTNEGLIDSDLMKLKVSKVHINQTNISANGLREYVEKLIKEDYPIGAVMEFSNTEQWRIPHDWLKYEQLDDNNEDDNNYTIFKYYKGRVVMSKEKEIIIDRIYAIKPRLFIKLSILKRY